ncbi:MAG: urea amidolyase associated protein UAAP2 [Actinomycetota bacterium]
MTSGGQAVFEHVVSDTTLAARAPWSQRIRAGQHLHVIDLEGNQAVDFLVYSADDPIERYSAADTMSAQGNVYLTTGSVLRSNEGRPLMTIVTSNVDRHDTVGGACSRESNSLRYGHHTNHQHACVDNFLHELAQRGMGKHDLVPNVNFFMNVPVEGDGSLGIVDGISGPGKSVELRAEMDVIVVVSNCPQINNPCNGFNPTPVRMVVSASG